ILVDEYFFFCCTWIVNSAAKNYRQAEKVCQEGINTDMSITVKQCTGVDKVVGLMLLQKQ
ncbi:hypothetical protein, partial [Escherichia coli]|uniref:hypothetical protein n=1 Tax=Escherichia coli TaxID=562 RepID=UPI00398C4262